MEMYAVGHVPPFIPFLTHIHTEEAQTIEATEWGLEMANDVIGVDQAYIKLYPKPYPFEKNNKVEQS